MLQQPGSNTESAGIMDDLIRALQFAAQRTGRRYCVEHIRKRSAGEAVVTPLSCLGWLSEKELSF